MEKEKVTVYLDYLVKVAVNVEIISGEDARNKIINEGLSDAYWKIPSSWSIDTSEIGIIDSYLLKENWEGKNINPKIQEAIDEGIRNRKLHSEQVEIVKEKLLKDDKIYKVISKAVSENKDSTEFGDFLCVDRKYVLEAINLIPGLKVINEAYHKYNRNYDPFIEFTWKE